MAQMLPTYRNARLAAVAGGSIVVNMLKAELIKRKKVATFKTYNSIKSNVQSEPGGFIIDIEADESLIFIHSGRRKGAKYPPYKPGVGFPNIIEWIKARGIRGRDKRGRFISNKALSFLIARAIVRRGIKPTRILTQVERDFRPKLYTLIERAAAKDLEEDIAEIVKRFS